jgi:23S rRNA G2445 N2-methylase RlmL
MPDTARLDLFLAGTPGLEAELAAEAEALGLAEVRAEPGGVAATGG